MSAFAKTVQTLVSTNPEDPFTRAIFLILTHAIEWLSHKSID